LRSILDSIARFPAPARLGVFVGLLLLVWLPLALPLYRWLGIGNTGSTVTIVILYLEFLGLLQIWGREVHRYPQPFRAYGLGFSRRNLQALLLGLGVGCLSLAGLFGLETILGWILWQPPALSLWRTIGEGLIVALGVSLAEELVFRGWLLDELERDYRPTSALWISSLLFALLHFIRPLAAVLQTWPQFLGLVLLGLLLVSAKRWARGRLGLPIGLHAGLVWGNYVLTVANLVAYSGQVPAWVTGINHNPLAGAMGLLFLLGLLLSFGWLRRRQNTAKMLT